MSALFEAEHEVFRASCRSWLEREVAPKAHLWEQDGLPSALFEEAASHGFIGIDIPVEFGGAGCSDFRYNAILGEEACRLGLTSVSSALTTHSDIVTPYLLAYATPEQKHRWLPDIARGATVLAIAMTEPDAGSDVAGIRTTAVRHGDELVLNGTKTFITNGANADMVVVAARTSSDRHGGLSLVVVERGTPGFTNGRRLPKLGMHAQDTTELFFDDVRVPGTNLLGEEGAGFSYLMANLAQERLSIAVFASALAQAALTWTLEYVRRRTAFGRPIGSFQALAHRLADLAVEVDVTQTYVYASLERHTCGGLTAVEAAKLKLWATERLNRVVDDCLQMHGGYGYITEQPIARAFADARVSRIYGGTSEIMREIISRDLGLARGSA